MSARSWNAESYDSVGAPMTTMASAVLDRLILDGDETVLDAGCGTGRVSQLLLERVPRGRVIAVDSDPEMVRVARMNLGRQTTPGNRVSVRHMDLLSLDLEESVDVVFSTATFHWVLDHKRLFSGIHDVLVPGGRLVAQCGGEGNISALRSAGDEVARLPEFADHFEGWSPPWYYAGPRETADRLRSAGFHKVRTWLEPWPVIPDDPAEYTSTVTLGAQVQRLPEHKRDAYVHAVLERLDREPSGSISMEYVRLNIDAVKPE